MSSPGVKLEPLGDGDFPAMAIFRRWRCSIAAAGVFAPPHPPGSTPQPRSPVLRAPRARGLGAGAVSPLR